MIRILFLAANPADTSALRLGEEARAIRERLRAAQHRDQFAVEQEWAVRVGDLQAHLLRHQPHVVHFSGHSSACGQLVLEDSTGRSQPVPADALGQLFATLKDEIRCVVLNACFTETQARGIAASIDCVVGMSRAIRDDSAVAFAASFYQALAFGRSVQTAFELGCGEIGLAGLADHDVPRLVPADGIDPASVYLRGVAPESPP
ncbi:MAG TPA: CHAT domain-containing protein [Urbifossiella sp.]|nr:CHAT domain-containing protein [Urbifossiella sp.]